MKWSEGHGREKFDKAEIGDETASQELDFDDSDSDTSFEHQSNQGPQSANGPQEKHASQPQFLQYQGKEAKGNNVNKGDEIVTFDSQTSLIKFDHKSYSKTRLGSCRRLTRYI